MCFIVKPINADAVGDRASGVCYLVVSRTTSLRPFVVLSGIHDGAMTTICHRVAFRCTASERKCCYVTMSCVSVTSLTRREDYRYSACLVPAFVVQTSFSVFVVSSASRTSSSRLQVPSSFCSCEAKLKLWYTLSSFKIRLKCKDRQLAWWRHWILS